MTISFHFRLKQILFLTNDCCLHKIKPINDRKVV